jgi:hypothetical protein
MNIKLKLILFAAIFNLAVIANSQEQDPLITSALAFATKATEAAKDAFNIASQTAKNYANAIGAGLEVTRTELANPGAKAEAVVNYIEALKLQITETNKICDQYHKNAELDSIYIERLSTKLRNYEIAILAAIVAGAAYVIYNQYQDKDKDKKN